MKKLLVLLLVLVLACSIFASCDKKPANNNADQNPPVGDNTGEVENPTDNPTDNPSDEPADNPGGDVTDTPDDDNKEDVPPPHEHSFVVVEEKQPTCLVAGTVTLACSCGESKTEPGADATGHNMEVLFHNEATCISAGGTRYKCANCGITKTEIVKATGVHDYDENTEASRIIKCQTPNCSYVKVREFSGKYTEQIAYVFTESDLDEFYAIYDELDLLIQAAASYDPELHAYDTTSDVYAEYLVMEAKYDELYAKLEYIICQYQIAQINYHCNINNPNLEEIFEYISGVRTDLVADFYTFSEPIYNSMYREYYYYGMTEPEIMAFIFDSNAVADPEYKALVDRNNEIELEFNAIEDPTTSDRVLELYAEFVANNNLIAQKMGYSNYLEYAYESGYDRDYSYQDVQQIADYVKQYISPVYISVYNEWNTLTNFTPLTNEDIAVYYSQVRDSFFDNYESNVYLNDYIDLLAFTSNPDKMISFSDEFNSLMSEGNLFRGKYEGAYVTYLYGLDIPAAYFGEGYNSAFTVGHEFGHYMNAIYSGNQYKQSFDLLEMHSQGNEVLYLAYLNGKLETATGYELVETYNLLVLLDTIVTALAVDTFEQAVYLDYYEGAYSVEIMADGTITYDEYDLLFNSIIEDFGGRGYVNENYWRYVTIQAPCYYVSYSVSALSVLQLYPMAKDDFDTAIDAYLKLFTYVDEYENNDEYMTTEQVLEYAGLYSFTDERLYALIYDELYDERYAQP